MALPTTGAALRTWLIDVVLQGTAAALEWTASSAPVVNAVDMVELDQGHSVETDDDAAVMLSLTRVHAWRAAVEGTVDRFRVSSDGQTVDLQQVHEHAVAMLDRAESDYAAALAGGNLHGASITTIGYADDPYGPSTALEY
jgi:hypothetical protein